MPSLPSARPSQSVSRLVNHGRDARHSRLTMAGVMAATLVEPGRSRPRDIRTPSGWSRVPYSSACSPRGSAGPTSTPSAARRSSTLGTDHARTTPFPIVQGHENVGVVEDRARRGSAPGTASSSRPETASSRAEPALRLVPSARATFRTTSASGSRTTATRSPPPSRRTSSAVGAAHLRPGADLPGARRAPHRRRRPDRADERDPLAGLGRPAAAARRAPERGHGRGRRHRPSGARPRGQGRTARRRARRGDRPAPVAPCARPGARRRRGGAPEEVDGSTPTSSSTPAGTRTPSCPRSSFSGTAGRSSRSAPSSRSARGRSTPRCCAAAT